MSVSHAGAHARTSTYHHMRMRTLKKYASTPTNFLTCSKLDKETCAQTYNQDYFWSI